jgi:glutathione synthase/RimK-type ligase-like ATP-grasp enzyme
MRRVAFATSHALKDLTDDDRTAVAPLARRGIEAVPAVWNDPKVKWESFEQVIIRSPWDYHRHGPEFLAWLSHLDRIGMPVQNPTPILRWNLDKIYLRWIEERGGSVVPTEFIEKGAALDLAAVLKRRGWHRAVVKPTVSAGGSDTWITSETQAKADEKKARPLVDRCGLMIQPFLAEIETEGELSLLFFGGKYSHAVRKRPAGGDFRVQTDYGGTVEPALPSPATVREAQRIVDFRGDELLYARVDGVVVDDEFLLMEFEILEPQLFLPYHPQGAERFADAVLAMMRG